MFVSDQIDFGTGSDGNLVLKGPKTFYIEDYAGTKYSPADGIVPNFRTVSLTNGAILSARPYDSNTKKGGVVAFKALEVLVIDASSSITVNGLGHTGGRRYGNAAYPKNGRNANGNGPGRSGGTTTALPCLGLG